MRTQQRQIFQISSSSPEDSLSFRCYLRRPNMQADVQNISITQTVSQLKQFIKTALKLSEDSTSLKLVVNEVQLQDPHNLRDYLHQNAIIHVLFNLTEQQQQENNQKQFSLKIKQPPINCPVYELPAISNLQTIQALKEKIHMFYQNEHNDQDLARLQTKQIYLVYGGQILQNSKCLKDYQINKNGIVYVINGNKYVRQVTREQAQKRIKQVRNKHIQQPSIIHAEVSESKQEEQISNAKYQQNEVNPISSNNEQDFVIVQNMVFGQDSQGQEEIPQSQSVSRSGEYCPPEVSRSQKIIHRYDSLNNKLENSNKQQSDRKDQQVQNDSKDFISKIHEVHEGSELEENRGGRTAALQNYLPTQTEETVTFNIETQEINKFQHDIETELASQQPMNKETTSQYVESVCEKVSQSQQLQREPDQNTNTNENVTQSIQQEVEQKNQPIITEDEDDLLA